MRKRALIAVLGLAAVLCLPAAAWAGKKAGGAKGNGRAAPTVTCSPESTAMPVENTRPVSVCVAGFPEGDLLTVYVPWMGTPDQYTDLIFSRYIGPSGGFCFDAPPDWATIELAPGTYSIRTSWYRNGRGGGGKQGPTAEFTVLPQ